MTSERNMLNEFILIDNPHIRAAGLGESKKLMMAWRFELLPAFEPNSEVILAALPHFPAPTELEIRCSWMSSERRFEFFLITRTDTFGNEGADELASDIGSEIEKLIVINFPCATFARTAADEIGFLHQSPSYHESFATLRRKMIRYENQSDTEIPVLLGSPFNDFIHGVIAEENDFFFSIMVRCAPDGTRDEIERLFDSSSCRGHLIDTVREVRYVPLRLSGMFFEVEQILAAHHKISANLLACFSSFDINHRVEQQEVGEIRRRSAWGGLRFDTDDPLSHIVSQSEAGSLFTVPFNTFLPGIECGRPLVPPRQFYSQGISIGRANAWGQEDDFLLPSSLRDRHIFVCGASGTGKTSLLSEMALQDIASSSEEGMVVIDPHGDLVDRILARFPEDRLDDLILFDPSRCDVFAPIINPFEANSPEERDVLIQGKLEMIVRLYDPRHLGIAGPRFEEMFRNSLLTILHNAENGASWLDAPRLFTDEDFRNSILENVRDEFISNFWDRTKRESGSRDFNETVSWFSSKFSAFANDTVMRKILGRNQPSTFSFEDVMENGKILLASLNRGKIGSTNSRLLGMILAKKLEMAVLSRSENAPIFRCYIDEFSQFALDSFVNLFAEARKYATSITVANQHLNQLDRDLLASVLGNAGTIVSFRLGPFDSPLLEPYFQPQFDASMLAGLPTFEAATRITNEDGWDAFSLSTPRFRNSSGDLGQRRRIDEIRLGILKRQQMEQIARNAPGFKTDHEEINSCEEPEALCEEIAVEHDKRNDDDSSKSKTIVEKENDCSVDWSWEDIKSTMSVD